MGRRPWREPSINYERRCVVCACTETTPCETLVGPCGWASSSICTACDGRPADLYAELEALATAVAALLEHQNPKPRSLPARLRTALKRAQRALRPPKTRRMG